MVSISPTFNSSGRDISPKPLVSLVVPTLNEENNMPQLFASIPDFVDEVILVDGCSTDRTVELAKEMRPDVIVVHQTGKGKGSALRQGFQAANGDIIVMIDADGSTNPAEIPSFVGTLLAGADFAKGSRFMQGGGTSDMEIHRYLGNQFFVWVVRILFGGKYTDLCYGYNAFWTWALPLLNLDGDGFEIETMMNIRVLQAGLQVAEVPSFENRRFMGLSNLNAIRDGFRILGTIFKEWQQNPSLRIIRTQEKSVAEETFKSALHTLLEEAHRSVKIGSQLPADQQQDIVNKFLDRFDELMAAEMSSPTCYKLQKRYATHYRTIYETYLRQHLSQQVQPPN
jgi:glycosyltransferase involved in cell wall biosynthesis